ncbi:MAG TPA: hypothetical protein DD420_13130 [Streptomyces sp.]|nr:hypothetical protein [Streptomyces sp.]
MQGGPVREAIDSYALFALSNGWYVDGQDEVLVHEVEARLDELDLSGSLWQGIVDALVFGDAFQELVPGSGTRSDDIVMIQPRPAKMFDIETDEFGIKTGYTQYRSTGWLREDAIPLALDQMLHVSLFHVGGSKYGLSLVGSAKDDVDRDARMISSLVDSIEAHGKPRYHARVGVEGEDVSQTVLERVAEQLDQLQTNCELVTCRDTEITVLDAAGVGNTKVYSDLTIQRMACALGVPEEILGLGRGSTEATATVRQKCFEMKMGTIHGRLEREYNAQLIDRLTGEPGAVTLHFNDVSEEDELTVAQYVAAVLAADPMRPLASRKWAQKRLKLHGEDIPEEEDDVDDILAGIGGFDGVAD